MELKGNLQRLIQTLQKKLKHIYNLANSRESDNQCDKSLMKSKQCFDHKCIENRNLAEKKI